MGLEDFGKFYGGFEFPFPKIAGRYEGKKLIICGDSHNVWDDLDRFGCKNQNNRGSVVKNDWQFMTINKLIEVFPGSVEHCYSNEAESLIAFVAARRREYRKEFSGPEHLHSCNRGIQWRWPWRGNGTSALGACLTAICLGYAEIVLAGVPLDNGSHNGEPPWRRCNFLAEVEAVKEQRTINVHWRNARDLVFDGKVKSLSGRTMEWFGEP